MTLSIFRRKLSSLIYLTKYRLAVLSEKVQGVDFTASLLKHEIGTEKEAGAYFYGSTTLTPIFKQALDFVNITPKDSILDIGSGKGPALLRFTKYPFRRIMGIELSSWLVDVSKKNFKRLGKDSIEVLHADATVFTDLDDFNYFYLGNPFNQEVLDVVTDNIVNSYFKAPREIYLIYFHALIRTASVDKNRFKVVKELVDGTRTIRIYKLLTPSLKMT